MTKFCSALYLENLLTNIFAKLNLRGGVSCMPAALLFYAWSGSTEFVFNAWWGFQNNLFYTWSVFPENICVGVPVFVQ